ncbi:MAG: IMP cyclohydrolase [Candidatus Aminicenantales bacterium]|jgi:IMP cyclohydrolase
MNPTPGVLSTLEYAGRLISLGTAPDGAKAVIIYAITGRSPSSQARKLVFRAGGIWVQPTDEEVLKKGNVDLLVYPAVLFHQTGIAVSNGKQTTIIRDGLSREANPVSVLAGALEGWDFEPDAPIFTPRISGCVRVGAAGLSLIRRGPGGVTLRSFFEVPIRPGKAGLISTYQGTNSDPLPCFEGEPREMLLEGAAPWETAKNVYDALGPRVPGKDFRVAVACVFASLADPAVYDLHIINRQERT